LCQCTITDCAASCVIVPSISLGGRGRLMTCLCKHRGEVGVKLHPFAETRFRLSAKRTSPFKSAGGSVQSTTGRRAVHISLQSLYCSCKPVFCSHVTLTGYPLHSLVSPSLLLPCVTVCHHISSAVYTPAALHPVSNVQEDRWAPGPVWTGVENLAYDRNSIPGSSVRRESLYRPSCPSRHSGM